jgi:hypothetical protein
VAVRDTFSLKMTVNFRAPVQRAGDGGGGMLADGGGGGTLAAGAGATPGT